MSLEFNAENRNANLPVRCCSFCRRPGHNITRCDSQPIRMFERNTLIHLNSNNVSLEPRREFLRNYLFNEALHDSNVVRAFAISRCNANTRTNMASCIQLIIEYFMPYIQNNQAASQAAEAPEAESARPEQQVGRIVRRFGFSGSIYETGFQGRDNESLLYAIMFIEMITDINESAPLNRKFHITTNISENKEESKEECECSICYDKHDNKNFIKLGCGHEFCKDCVKQTLQNDRRKTPCCAFCRTEIKNFEFKQECIKDEFNDLIISEI